MVIGVLLIELFIPGSHSLKEKRMVVKGLKDVEGSVVDKGFSAILNFIEEKAVAEIVDTKIELL